MKKITSLLIIGLLLVSGLYLAPSAHADFPDVPTSHPHYDAIMWLQSEGHIAGYPDGRFGPEDPITRAAFMKILTMASGRVEQEWLDSFNSLPDINKNAVVSCFPDVPQTAWYYPFICQVSKGLSGYPDGTFKPDRNINFAEASKLIAHVFRFDPSTSGVSGIRLLEWPEDEVWFRPYVNAMSAVRATPTDITDFAQPLNRGQLAEMAYRIQNEILDKDFTTYSEIAGEVVVDDETFPNFEALFQVIDESDVVRDECNLAGKIGPLRLEKYFDPLIHHIVLSGYSKRLVSSPNADLITNFEFTPKLVCRESGLEVFGKGIVLNEEYISGVWKDDEITLGIYYPYPTSRSVYHRLPGECTITYSLPGPKIYSDYWDYVDVYNEFRVSNSTKCKEYGYMTF